MRVKGGKTTKRRHKKILKANKGYRLTKSKLYKVAHEAYMHAGQYSRDHRRARGSQMRRIWISRLNAAAKQRGMKYNKLIHGIRKNKIELDKKMLADIALNNPNSFDKIVEVIK